MAPGMHRGVSLAESRFFGSSFRTGTLRKRKDVVPLKDLVPLNGFVGGKRLKISADANQTLISRCGHCLGYHLASHAEGGAS